MNALDLARWQFGITTIYHFLFMPLSIGLSLLIAILQAAIRTLEQGDGLSVLLLFISLPPLAFPPRAVAGHAARTAGGRTG